MTGLKKMPQRRPDQLDKLIIEAFRVDEAEFMRANAEKIHLMTTPDAIREILMAAKDRKDPMAPQ